MDFDEKVTLLPNFKEPSKVLYCPVYNLSHHYWVFRKDQASNQQDDEKAFDNWKTNVQSGWKSIFWSGVETTGMFPNLHCILLGGF